MQHDCVADTLCPTHSVSSFVQHPSLGLLDETTRGEDTACNWAGPTYKRRRQNLRPTTVG